VAVATIGKVLLTSNAEARGLGRRAIGPRGKHQAFAPTHEMNPSKSRHQLRHPDDQQRPNRRMRGVVCMVVDYTKWHIMLYVVNLEGRNTRGQRVFAEKEVFMSVCKDSMYWQYATQSSICQQFDRYDFNQV
jgi:hypothetical protein